MLASLHIPLAVASEERRTLVVLRPGRSLNRFVFQLRSSGNKILVLTGVSVVCLRAVMTLRERVLVGAVTVGAYLEARKMAYMLPVKATNVSLGFFREKYGIRREFYKKRLAEELSKVRSRRDKVLGQLRDTWVVGRWREWLTGNQWGMTRKLLRNLWKRRLLQRREELEVIKQEYREAQTRRRRKLYSEVREIWFERHIRQRAWRRSLHEARRLGTESLYALQVYGGYDIRDLITRQVTSAGLTEDLSCKAADVAKNRGLRLDEPIVTLHVRESGYRPAYTGTTERPVDLARTAKIQDYGRAVDELVGRGYQVVRIGDPTMTEFSRPGVTDLAIEDSVESQMLQLWSVANSRFFLVGESGPSELGLLFGVPMLQVNIVNIQSNYPLRSRDRCIVKLALQRESNKSYSLKQMIDPSFVFEERDEVLDGGRYLDNTADDLQFSVQEMIDSLVQPQPPSVEQSHFADLMSILLSDSRSASRIARKQGKIGSQVGRGFICKFFAKRYMNDTDDFVMASESVVATDS